jgi:hypothetical protein
MRKTIICLMILSMCILFGCNMEEKTSNISQNISDINTDNSGSEKQEEYFDITPQAILDEIGCQIFKSNMTCASYVLYEGEKYSISNFFGGWGIVDMQVCDFNGDGQADILYTSSWGSGMHRWEIGLFNFTDMTDEMLYSSLVMTENGMGDIVFEKTAENEFDIYSISFDISEAENAFIDFRYSKEELIGKVINENSAPKIIIN